MKLRLFAPLGLALAVAACGATSEQRAATGGLGGAAVGAAVGGPIGAVVGAGGGAAAGLYRDEAEEFVAERDIAPFQRDEAQVAEAPQQRDWQEGPELTNEEVREAQQNLAQMGLYDGQIDGLYGPRTIAAVTEFQRAQGMSLTGALDDQTQLALADAPTGEGQIGQQPIGQQQQLQRDQQLQQQQLQSDQQLQQQQLQQQQLQQQQDQQQGQQRQQ